jgi:SAM-dependent methyltransferase
MPDASAEVEEKLRSGEVDLCALIAGPERFGELGRAAEAMRVEALLAADPKLGDGAPGDGAWRRLAVDRDASLADLDPDQRAWVADMVRFWRRVPRGVIETISPKDWMYDRTPDKYFSVGPTTIRLVRLAMLETRKEDVESILDFGCGYGRILRFFKAAFPEATLAACDILRDAVDFCAEAFGATPVYAEDEPGETKLPREYDLIWVGSLFTHLSAPQWGSLLDRFEAALVPGGLLLFTTQGRFIRDQLADKAWRDAYDRPIWLNWGAPEEEVDKGVAEYDREGFGFIEWSALDRHYGSSIATPSWVLGRLETRPGLRIVGYRERGWGGQDLVVCSGVRPDPNGSG